MGGGREKGHVYFLERFAAFRVGWGHQGEGWKERGGGAKEACFFLFVLFVKK